MALHFITAIFSILNKDILEYTVTCQKYKCTSIFHSTAIQSVILCFIENLKSHMISMYMISFQNNSIFYNSYFKCIEQGVLE